MSFNPLLSLARNAKRQKMDMQCDPQWVLDLATERDQLRAELDAIRGQQAATALELRKASSWICREVEAGTTSATHWAIRLRERADQIESGTSQQPDAWPKLEKPAKVGAVRFCAGISTKLVVEAAQRYDEYCQQPEVEAERLEKFWVIGFSCCFRQSPALKHIGIIFGFACCYNETSSHIGERHGTAE